MYVIENPVLQRELLVNLRMVRAFILLFVYQALLGCVVYFAWPQDTHLDLTANSENIETPLTEEQKADLYAELASGAETGTGTVYSYQKEFS